MCSNCLRELPECKVCLEPDKYEDEEGKPTHLHMNPSKQHPENWGEIMALANLELSKNQKIELEPKKITK